MSLHLPKCHLMRPTRFVRKTRQQPRIRSLLPNNHSNLHTLRFLWVTGLGAASLGPQLRVSDKWQVGPRSPRGSTGLDPLLSSFSGRIRFLAVGAFPWGGVQRGCCFSMGRVRERECPSQIILLLSVYNDHYGLSSF